MRPLLAACLLSAALMGCTSPTPVAAGTDSSPPPVFDASTGQLLTGIQLAPGTMTVDVGDTAVTIHSMPANPAAQIVDYVIEYAESGDVNTHVVTAHSYDSFPVEIMRARFYADTYVFKAEDELTRQVFAQKTVYIPPYNLYPQPSPNATP